MQTEYVADFTRRSESKASEWPGSNGRNREVKATGGKLREQRKVEPDLKRDLGAWCRWLAARGH
jgi:hypothetical protein